MNTDNYQVLRFPNFRNFILARQFFTFAVNMLATVVGWQVYTYTKDEFSLGLIGLAEVIPFLLTALFGGLVADVLDRKTIISFSAAVYTFCAICLLVLSWKFAYLFQTIGVLPIYAIIFVTGIARGFLAPAQNAFLAQLVPRELYAQSAVWNSVIWHISAIGGPAIGGLLYAWKGVEITYLLVVVFALIGFILFMSVPKQPMPEQIKSDENIFQRLSIGLKFVFGQPIMLGALALDMLAVLFGGAVAMLPVFADKILHVDALGLGILRAAPAAGALLMAAIMTSRPPLSRAGRNLFIAVMGFGVCTICFALSTNVYLSVFLLALTGAFDNVSVVIRSTIMQLYTPDDMRGRVSAVNSIFISTSNELGAFESGTAARFFTLVPSVWIGGCITVVVALVTAKLAPQLRNLNLRKELDK
jgi:MFS family permease